MADYDVVVIGSGYGGGISASRLARAGRSVCLLERGKEFLPGEFPDTLLEFGYHRTGCIYKFDTEFVCFPVCFGRLAVCTNQNFRSVGQANHLVC